MSTGEEHSGSKELLGAFAGRLGSSKTPGGSVLVADRGSVLLEASAGLADLDREIANTTTTAFRLASVSKQFTATAILILAGDGRLSIDDRITAALPELAPPGDPITIRHLLTHTSGLSDYERVLPDGEEQVTDGEVLELLARDPRLDFRPGSRYRYSNSGYALLAVIVERLSNRPFGDLLRQRVFDPLGMTSSVAHREGITVVSNRAFGHTLDGHGFRRHDQSRTSAVLGDGGIYSSVADLHTWHRSGCGRSLVRPELLVEAGQPHVLTGRPETSYGFGWYVTSHRGLGVAYHTGETAGFRTILYRIPERGFCAIVLCNRDDVRTLEMVQELVAAVVTP